jgi:hypothetical protein
MNSPCALVRPTIAGHTGRCQRSSASSRFGIVMAVTKVLI